jgi:hypothetical protein
VSDAAADQLFLGRQPILDREQRLHAYELLFRSGSRNFAEVTDGVQATATVIANAFSELGIEAALGSHRGFINVDEAFLFSDMLELLPRHAVVLEILETVPPTPAVVERCAALKAAGFTLALDDVIQLEPEFADLFSAYTDSECDNIDRKLKKQQEAIDQNAAAQKKALDKEIIDSKTKAKKQEEIDKKSQAAKEALEAEAEKKKRKLQREAAEIEKKVKLYETAISIPDAAFKAFSAMAGIPVVGPALGAAAAAAATGLGLLKLKMIKDQPLPEYAEGGVADRPSIFGEKGKELAVPLTSTQGIAAIDLFVDRLLNALSLKLQKSGNAISNNSSSSGNSSGSVDLSGYTIKGDVFFTEEKIGTWLGTVLRRGSENGGLRFHQRGIYA